MKYYRKFVARNKTTYKKFLRDVCLDSAGRRNELQVYNRGLFALLSVNTSYEKTASAYNAMEGIYWTGQKKIMHKLMKHGLHYAHARGGYINAFTKDYLKNPKRYLKKAGEPWNQYRKRLVGSIKGLGFIKVSFFITLVYPEADLCCLDRWILRCAGIHHSYMGKLSGQFFYQSVENKLRKEARRLKVSMFQYQWSIWDKIRSDTGAAKPFNSMSVLVNT